MIRIVLQFNAKPVYLEYLLLLLVTLVAIIMGLFIVFQAYRGYRRNTSRQMLFLAIGLALLTVVPFALSLIIASLGQMFGFGYQTYTYLLPIATRLIEIGGLAALLYSLSIRK